MSIFETVKAIRKTKGDTPAQILTLILLVIFLTSMFFTGALKLNDCPAEPFIPKWLLVMGIFGLLRLLVSQVCNRMVDDDEENCCQGACECMLEVFLFAWFVAGSVWVFRTYGDVSYTKDSENYCERPLFRFSFVIQLGTYILMGSSLCCCCMFGCMAAIMDD
ncbi:transmembrane protein 272-like [Symsagittifera roscoffensis]|uniref:transmembrane protein 272-like n=1 Tax=Symsagittifera roscoffensis TaxID=84072 RepID=UPI00307C56E0